jgi:sulfur-oxidizing protein SoxY
MPARAEDAAIVPVTMRVTLPPGDSRRLKALTLVIDNNPVPVAATFTFSDSAGVSVISTRVRINSYTNVHVVAELSDSRLYLAQTFVKASGGCSAPAAKNADEAIATLGQMRFRVFGKPSGAQREAQVMIRHPNNSGLQRDHFAWRAVRFNGQSGESVLTTSRRSRAGDAAAGAIGARSYR